MTPTPDTRPRACRRCDWTGTHADTAPVVGLFGGGYVPGCPRCGGRDLAWLAPQQEPESCPMCKVALADGSCPLCGKVPADKLGGRHEDELGGAA